MLSCCTHLSNLHVRGCNCVRVFHLNAFASMWSRALTHYGMSLIRTRVRTYSHLKACVCPHALLSNAQTCVRAIALLCVLCVDMYWKIVQHHQQPQKSHNKYIIERLSLYTTHPHNCCNLKLCVRYVRFVHACHPSAHNAHLCVRTLAAAAESAFTRAPMQTRKPQTTAVRALWL